MILPKPDIRISKTAFNDTVNDTVIIMIMVSKNRGSWKRFAKTGLSGGAGIFIKILLHITIILRVSL